MITDLSDGGQNESKPPWSKNSGIGYRVLAVAWVEAIQQIIAVRDSIEPAGNLGLSELEIVHLVRKTRGNSAD